MCGGVDTNGYIYSDTTKTIAASITRNGDQILSADFMDTGCSIAIGGNNYQVHIFSSSDGEGCFCDVTAHNLPGCALCRN